VKIKSIRTVQYSPKSPSLADHPQRRRDPWPAAGPVANPMTEYPRYAAYRPDWMPRFAGGYACVVEAEDGTVGFAPVGQGQPAALVIDDHLGPLLLGEDALATEKIYDMALRMCTPYGAAGLASFAISALDLALWDLKGKLLGLPVYSLIGGPAKDEMTCYATGADTDWYLELGFGAVKLPCPYGPADGLDGLRKNVDLIRRTRDQIGDERDLMLDCWMAFDVEYAVRLAEEIRPYKVRWLEDCLRPDDFKGHEQLRKRIPWQGLATGEHWHTAAPFQHAAGEGLVDIFQPDINWVGGMTALLQISALARAANIKVIPHAGGNTAYGQHACFGLPGIPWTEYFVGTPPGIPLEETVTEGLSTPVGGKLVPSAAPGFGIPYEPET